MWGEEQTVDGGEELGPQSGEGRLEVERNC